MNAIKQFEFGGQVPHTRNSILTVSGIVMRALCGDAPDYVPDEYTHCKPTAVEFVKDRLLNSGVLPETIMAGVQTAQARYAKS